MTDEVSKAMAYAVITLELEKFEDQEIVALNVALLQFGNVSPTNIAYQPALDAELITENGEPLNEAALGRACYDEAAKRVQTRESK